MDRENVVGSHRKVFREEIRNAIRDAIFAGELKPGDRVIETYWAKELGPFKGTRGRLMTEKDIQDNYSVRICLESKSIRDAITLLDDAQLEELAAQLRSILKEMDVCAGQGDLRAFTECDTAFHRAIIDATGNQVLLKLWEQCNMRNWFMVSALTDSASLKQLQSGHQHIFAAICAKDVAEATSTLEHHLTSLMEGFMRAEST